MESLKGGYKDPSHLGNLEEILGVYPDACFIHIRRDPSETLPSICSLTKQVRGGFTKNIDLKELGQKTLDFWAKSNEKMNPKNLICPKINTCLLNMRTWLRIL